jgi:MFS family permease
MMANGTIPQASANDSVPKSGLPGARAALILLLLINLFNYIDRQVLSAVVRNIREELLPNDDNAGAKMGLLMSAFMITYMVFAPVFGWLADRYSRWKLIGVGVILWSLASGASGVPWPVAIGHAYICLLLTRCFVGIGEAAYGPAAPTLISDLYPVKVRGKVLAWFYAAIPVGSALGYTLGGLVVNTFHLEWRWAFYLVVPPGIFLGVLCFLMREPKRGQADIGSPHRQSVEAAPEPAPNISLTPVDVVPPGAETEEEPAPVPEHGHARLSDLKSLLHTKSYVLDTLGMTAMTFALGALAFWMPDYLIERKAPNLGPLDPVTGFGAIVVVAGFAATLLGGMSGDWLRPRYPGSYFLVSGGGMIIGFFMLLLVLWSPFPQAWYWVFLAVFFLFFNTGPSNTILANVTHPAIRSSAFAVNIFVIHALGDAVSPALVGLISDSAKLLSNAKPAWMSDRVAVILSEYRGLNAGFLFVSFMTLVGGAIWLWGARYLERDTELATQRLGSNPPPI